MHHEPGYMPCSRLHDVTYIDVVTDVGDECVGDECVGDECVGEKF